MEITVQVLAQAVRRALDADRIFNDVHARCTWVNEFKDTSSSGARARNNAIANRRAAYKDLAALLNKVLPPQSVRDNYR